MTKNKHEEEIVVVIQTHFGKPVKYSQNIYKISTDSHSPINLSFVLESAFDIEFDENEWNAVKTIGGVIELTLYKIESAKAIEPQAIECGIIDNTLKTFVNFMK